MNAQERIKQFVNELRDIDRRTARLRESRRQTELALRRLQAEEASSVVQKAPEMASA
jgi:hypothetical protein